MRFTITTDIFCEGDQCGNFVGTSGLRINKRGAIREALSQGWRRINGKYYCTVCKCFTPINRSRP